MEEDEIKEAIKAKTGPELFRELVRQLPLVFVEDYYKNGIWQNDLMRLDIQVLNAHRLEAGAPDLPPLSEIKMPEVPEPPKPMQGMLQVPQLPGGHIRPVVTAAGAMWPASAVLTALGAAQTVAPPGVVMPPRPGATQVLGGSTAAADLRQIALFISKWRFDPAQASALLMRLTTLRRNFVMQNFKDATVVNGAAVPVAKLEEYIAQCEKSGAWAVLEAGVSAKAPAVVMPGATAPAVGKAGFVIAPPAKAGGVGPEMLAGLKRTFDQTMAFQAALPKNAGQVVQQPGPPVAKMRPAFAS